MNHTDEIIALKKRVEKLEAQNNSLLKDQAHIRIFMQIASTLDEISDEIKIKENEWQQLRQLHILRLKEFITIIQSDK